MISGTKRFKPLSSLIYLAILLFFFTFPSPVSALTEVEVNPVNTPEGAVVLIVDGLSAPFIYPELTPYALDSTALDKARLENIPKIDKESARVLEFRAPQTFTEGGHSVLVTGNPGADSELVSFKDATVFDVLHNEGYLCIAIMEKGDSWSICAEQDIILKDENNSINNMKIVLEQHANSPETEIPEGLVEVLEKSADKAPGYVTSKETRERYKGYDKWGIETACDVVKYMANNMPEQKYLLTVNVGAVDSSGHHRDNYGYIDCIECLDADLFPLYDLCKKNNLAFVFTADHGMGFSRDDSKGGHQSEKFTDTDEAQLVPLIVHTEDIKKGVVSGKHSQEDFTPTLLGILDIAERPRFVEGKQILLTGHANLKVKLPEKGSVDLIKDGKTISSLKNDDQFIFLGLEPENTYTIKVTLNSGKSLEEEEKELVLEADSVLEFVEKGKKNLENAKSNPSSKNASEEKSTSTAGFFKGTSDSGFGHIAAYILIGLVNLAGIIVIAKILKKE
jgi:bisphosphoglycerate-independent phosphoglycerate mutase (AlkP superfamily)